MKSTGKDSKCGSSVGRGVQMSGTQADTDQVCQIGTPGLSKVWGLFANLSDKAMLGTDSGQDPVAC